MKLHWTIRLIENHSIKLLIFKINFVKFKFDRYTAFPGFLMYNFNCDVQNPGYVPSFLKHFRYFNANLLWKNENNTLQMLMRSRRIFGLSLSVTLKAEYLSQMYKNQYCWRAIQLKRTRKIYLNLFKLNFAYLIIEKTKNFCVIFINEKATS